MWFIMYMIHLKMTQFYIINKVFCAPAGVVSVKWHVTYSPPICAARGSSVIIGCRFAYPNRLQVQQVLWCSMRSNHDKCLNEPYVYDSKANNNQNNFQYIGDKTSDCSLLISNINQTHSGVYRFRFITNKKDGHWTGEPGVNISVHSKYKRFTLKNYSFMLLLLLFCLFSLK